MALEETYESSFSARPSSENIDYIQAVYGFTVLTNYIKVFETDSTRAFTFGIYREDREEGGYPLLENLVMEEKIANEVDTTYIAHLIQYDITEQDILDLNHNRFNNADYLGNHTETFILVDDGTNPEDSGKIIANPDCFEIQWVEVPPTTCMYQNNHTYEQGEVCPYWGQWGMATPGGSYPTNVPIDCPPGASGGSYTGTGSGGTVGGSGSPYILSTNNGLPELEDPEEDDDTPCEKIQSLTNNFKYKTEFKKYNNNTNFSDNQESGFYGKNNSNGKMEYFDTPSIGNNKVTLPNDAQNATHVHNNNPKTLPDGTVVDQHVKIHSPIDLMRLIGKIKNNNTANVKNSFLVVLSNEGIHALTITESFNVNNTYAMWQEFASEYDEEAQKNIENYNLSVVQRKYKVQKLLLGGIKKLGLENKVALFEATVINQNDPNINNMQLKWEQKYLNSNGNLKSANCEE